MAKNMLETNTVLVIGKKIERYQFNGVWGRSDKDAKGTTALSDVIVIAEIDVIKKEVTIPKTPKSEIPLLVATELKRAHFFDPKSVVFDYIITNESQSNRTLDVFAAKRIKIDDVLERAKVYGRVVRMIPRALIPENKDMEFALNETFIKKFNFLPSEERAALHSARQRSVFHKWIRIASLCFISMAAALALASIAALGEAQTAKNKYDNMKISKDDKAYSGYRETVERYALWKTAIERNTTVSEVIEKMTDCPSDVTLTGITVHPLKNGVTMEISGTCKREETASAYVDSINKGKYGDARLKSLERDNNGIVFHISVTVRKAGA